MIEYRTGHAICLVFRGTVLFSRDKLESKLVGPYTCQLRRSFYYEDYGITVSIERLTDFPIMK